MGKPRAIVAEEEAKKDPNYRPTKDLKADEEKADFHFPWTALIIVGFIILLMIGCIVTICIIR